MADRIVVDMNDTSRCGRTAADLGLIEPLDEPVLVVEDSSARFATAQYDDRWATIVLPRDVGAVDSGIHRAVLHAALQHLRPGGRIIASIPPTGLTGHLELCRDADLTLERYVEGTDVVVVHRRSTRFNVHDLVAEARNSIRRHDPHELAERLAGSDPPLVLDTRTHTDRQRFGVIPGSVHTPRTVLEWQLDPANGYGLAAVRGFDHPLVVVCNGGYSSSLAAANLARLGFADVADLRGGVHAWRLAGLPLVDPDHSHLDPPPPEEPDRP